MNSSVVINFLANNRNLRSGAAEVVQSLGAVGVAVHRVRNAMAGIAVSSAGFLTGTGLKAASFEREMRNVNSVVQDSEKVFRRTSDAVLEIATQVPRSANELAQGAYTVVSAGFTRAAQTTSILQASARAASAGLTTVDVAANAVVTSLNAYGPAAGSAAHVSDLLFKTVEVGQVSFEQLAVNLGDFIGIANASGASLAETLAAYSAITIATGQASRSATSLQGIYRQLIKPSVELDAALNRIGFTSGRASIKTLGLQGTLEALSGSVGGSETALAKLFPDVEGLNGVLALTGPNAQRARDAVNEFTTESAVAGATLRAQAEQAKSFGYQMDQVKSTMGAVSIQLGRAVVPFLKLFAFFLKAVADALFSIPAPIKTVFMGLVALAAVLSTAGAAWLFMSKAIFLTKLAMTALRIPAIANALMTMVSTSRAGAIAMRLFGLSSATAASQVKMLAGAIGLAIAAALAVPVVSKMITNKLIPQDIDAMSKSLLNWSKNQEISGRLTSQFGEGLQTLGADIKRFTTENDSWKEKLTPKGLEHSVRRVDELDKALARLVHGGASKEAIAIGNQIKESLFSQGFTQGQWNQAFNDYETSLGELGVAQQNAAGSGGTLEGQLDAIAASAEDAQKKIDAYNDRIKELQGQAKDFLSISGLLAGIEDTNRKTFDDAKAAADAQKKQADASKNIASAQLEVIKNQKEINRIMVVTNGMPIPGSDSWIKLQEAQNGVADATGRMTGAQDEANAEYEKVPATIDQVIAALEAQISKYNEFQNNLQIATLRGIPLDIAHELQGMGQEGVDLANMLATAPPEEFDKLKGLLVEKVRIQGEEVQREMDTQLTTAAATARWGAANTVNGILDEVRRLAPGIRAEMPDVAKALADLGVDLGINKNTTGVATGDIPDTIRNPALANPFSLPKAVPQMPGEIDPWGRKVISKNTPGPVKPDPSYEVYSTLADAGAMLRPGVTVVQNNTQLPEYVLTATQMRNLIPSSTSRSEAPVSRSHVEHKTTYQFGDIYAQDLDGAIKQADHKRRLAALAG